MKHILRIVFLTFCSVICAQAQDLLNYPLDTINGEEVYRYEVERSIGLYRIGVNFNVPQGEIIRLNPQLRERGLHYGETILIPTNRKVEARQPQAVPDEPAVVEIPVVVETMVEEPETEPVTVSTTEPVIVSTTEPVEEPVTVAPRRVVELALMLPFESQQTKRSANAERMTEFYQGALLALHQLQNDSTLYRLRVYDTERSERRVNALCDSTELDSVAAILGLVYPIQIERMATWCAAHNIPLMLPFNDEAELQDNPYLLQFNSPDEQEADSLCRWIKQHDVNCVMIDVRDADLSNMVRALRQQMRKNDLSYSSLALFDLVKDSAVYALDKERENLIILHTDRYAQARILLPHIAKLRDAGYAIRIVSQYSWQKETISLPQVYTSVFTSEKPHEAYDELWNRYFVSGHSSDVPRYDLLGYDLMQALVGWIQGQKSYTGLQATIQWQQEGNGGWQNTGVNVIEK